MKAINIVALLTPAALAANQATRGSHQMRNTQDMAGNPTNAVDLIHDQCGDILKGCFDVFKAIHSNTFEDRKNLAQTLQGCNDKFTSCSEKLQTLFTA